MCESYKHIIQKFSINIFLLTLAVYLMCMPGLVVASFNWMEPMLLVSSSANSACLYFVICVIDIKSTVSNCLLHGSRKNVNGLNKNGIKKISSMYIMFKCVVELKFVFFYLKIRIFWMIE